MVPSAFIVSEPATGVGAEPGVSVTLVPMTAATPFVVSFPMIEAVVPPVALIGLAEKSSSTALIVGVTVTVTTAVSQIAPFGAARHT
jgi:hypothetical protein